MVDAHVLEDVEAVLVRPAELSAMMVSEADLGEKIMRALILRRVLVIERGQGVVLVGSSRHPQLAALQNFLRRNAFPNMTLDSEQDAEAIALLERLTPQPDDFPLIFCPDGTVFRNPDEGQLASCLGLIPEFDPTHVYDVTIVGAGPAGLRSCSLCGVRRIVGGGARLPRARWAGRHERAHRELSGLSYRHLRAGTRGPRVGPGAEVRRAYRNPVPRSAHCIATGNRLSSN